MYLSMWWSTFCRACRGEAALCIWHVIIFSPISFFVANRFKISVSDIIRSQYTDQVSTLWLMHVNMCFPWCDHRLWFSKCVSLCQWFTLDDVKSGRLRLILEWVPAVSCNDDLDQVSATFFTICSGFFRYSCTYLKCYIRSSTQFIYCAHRWVTVMFFFYVDPAAGDAATVSPVVPEQGCFLCSSALCLYGQSALIARESFLILCTESLYTKCAVSEI